MNIGPTYVQRLGHDGRPIEAPRLGSWHKPPAPPPNVTPEGVEAVAAALGMERVEVDPSGTPALSEGLRAVLGG